MEVQLRAALVAGRDLTCEVGGTYVDHDDIATKIYSIGGVGLGLMAAVRRPVGGLSTTRRRQFSEGSLSAQQREADYRHRRTAAQALLFPSRALRRTPTARSRPTSRSPAAAGRREHATSLHALDSRKAVRRRGTFVVHIGEVAKKDLRALGPASWLAILWPTQVARTLSLWR